jgi:hypothetical protein
MTNLASGLSPVYQKARRLSTTKVAVEDRRAKIPNNQANLDADGPVWYVVGTISLVFYVTKRPKSAIRTPYNWAGKL